jgi:UDP-2-acetamido-3-amino-2,3-dideoxy-glucuronate N-acetyltransferase
MTEPFIHPSAFVDPPCEIGDGTQIWHFCHISSNVKLGQRCKLGQNVFVASGVTVGNNVKIQNNVSIYAGVILEDDVFCGPSMVFTNVKTPRSAVPRNTGDDYLKTLVKQGASIGANATIVCGTTIGYHALIGAGAVVTRDVPDYGIMVGNPARRRGWACQCGIPLKLEGEFAKCTDCNRQYCLQGGLLTQGEKECIS